jgi:hypothetical protein
LASVTAIPETRVAATGAALATTGLVSVACNAASVVSTDVAFGVPARSAPSAASAASSIVPRHCRPARAASLLDHPRPSQIQSGFAAAKSPVAAIAHHDATEGRHVAQTGNRGGGGCGDADGREGEGRKGTDRQNGRPSPKVVSFSCPVRGMPD